MNPSTPSRLDDLLQEWQQLLTNWASSGMLSRAAQKALQLEGEPEQLRDLASEWIEGDFNKVPPVVLLPSASMPGAAGAYAISTGTIYLNQEWLQSASREHALAVLTEELGHHLDRLIQHAAIHQATREQLLPYF
jgi:Zn-dependent protease with chaperone function